MSQSTKPSVTLYAHIGPGPNPHKVAFLLEALKIDYEVEGLEFGNGERGCKNPKYLKVCPNGRLPTIVDHANNGLVVWESGAILYYLAEKYDTEGNYFGRTVEEKTEVMVWLTHQLSGLGPTQGQVNWFLHYFKSASGEEASQAVKARYTDESYRLYAVLEARLEEEGRQWIALDRLTIADMAFHSWLRIAHFGGLSLDKYPKLKAYTARMEALDVVKDAMAKMPQK